MEWIKIFVSGSLLILFWAIGVTYMLFEPLLRLLIGWYSLIYFGIITFLTVLIYFIVNIVKGD